MIICWGGGTLRTVKADEGEGIEGLAETIVNLTVRDQLGLAETIVNLTVRDQLSG